MEGQAREEDEEITHGKMEGQAREDDGGGYMDRSHMYMYMYIGLHLKTF